MYNNARTEQRGRGFGAGIDDDPRPLGRPKSHAPAPPADDGIGFLCRATGEYVPHQREDVWFSRLADRRDRLELNPNGFQPPRRKPYRRWGN